jgi:hypothetical protein
VNFFQGTLKTIASRHKCDKVFPKQINLFLLGNVFSKGICDRILYFQKIVSPLGDILLIKIIILKVVIEYGIIEMNDWLKA